MKYVFTVFFLILIFPFFTIMASAEDFYGKTAAQFGTDILDDGLSAEEKEISGEFDAAGNYDVGGALAKLWKKFISSICEEIKNNMESFTTLLALSILCALGLVMSDKKTCIFIELIACAAASVIMLGNVEGIVSQTVNAMYRLSDYSKAALPVVFTAAATGGAVSSAATKFAAVSFALDVLMSVSQSLIIPTVYSFIALTVSNSLFPHAVISAVQKLCKWLAGTMMTAMTIAFTTYISMVGAIGAAVDTTAVKTARSFISGVLPVVGGMISDASAMVLSAAGVVKNCAGVFGLIAVAVMCVGPFAVLSVKMLLLKGISAVADSMQSTRLSALYSGISTAMGLLLGLLGSCGIMLFISLTAGMKVVSF